MLKKKFQILLWISFFALIFNLTGANQAGLEEVAATSSSEISETKMEVQENSLPREANNENNYLNQILKQIRFTDEKITKVNNSQKKITERELEIIEKTLEEKNDNLQKTNFEKKQPENNTNKISFGSILGQLLGNIGFGNLNNNSSGQQNPFLNNLFKEAQGVSPANNISEAASEVAKDKDYNLFSGNVGEVCKKDGGGSLTNPNNKACTTPKVNAKLIKDVENAVKISGVTAIYVSCWRSQAHQDSICAGGGTGAKACGSGGSRHTQGLAVDIKITKGTEEQKTTFILAALSGGWTIGCYAGDTHTHIGLDGGESVWRTFGPCQQYHKKAFLLAQIKKNAKNSVRSVVSQNAEKALSDICK